MSAKVQLDTRRLDELRKSLDERAQELIDKTTFDVEATAKQNAPVLTGFMKNSIASVTGRLKNFVSVGAEYAIYVELGTRHRSAHPFLVPALESHRAAFLAAWKRLFQ